MAKITITLEDRRDETGKPTVSLDMTSASSTPFGGVAHSAAVRLSEVLFGMASSEEALGNLPAYRRQPSTTTLH